MYIGPFRWLVCVWVLIFYFFYLFKVGSKFNIFLIIEFKREVLLFAVNVDNVLYCIFENALSLCAEDLLLFLT